MNKSFEKSARRNDDPKMALMKVITKQPGKMPVPYNQKNVLDGSYLKMIKDERKFTKAEKTFGKSGSTSSIYHGCPNLNLNALTDLF